MPDKVNLYNGDGHLPDKAGASDIHQTREEVVNDFRIINVEE